MDKELERKLAALKESVDTLVLIELCKQGASREQARAALGTLDNNAFSRLNAIYKNGKNN